ncbi:MAG: FecR domain-containing protein [Fuerstiella sp.]
MKSFHDDPEVDELFRAVLDQDLTEIQVRRLEKLLLSNPKVREDYLRLTEIDHFLHQCYHGEEVVAVVHPQDQKSKSTRAFWLVWASACVVAVSVLGALFFREADSNALQDPLQKGRIVATLTRNADAFWNQDSDIRALPDGSKWRVGDWIQLERGTALLTLENDVECTITGKVIFQVTEDLNCFVTEGIGTFDVPKKSTGFTVRTPDGAFEDLGTSFGVVVSGQGQSEVHVLQGAVNARVEGTESENQMKLTAGQAAKVDRTNETLAVTEFRPETFSKPLAFLAGVQRLPRNFTFWSQPMTSVAPLVELERLESMWLSKERIGVVLTQELLITSTYGNEDTPLEAQEIRLPAGTRLSSYLLHFSHATVPSEPRDVSGSIRFSSPVVALIRSSDELMKTDSIFCFKQTKRDLDDFMATRRGSDESNDYVRVSQADRREVKFELLTAASPSLDQVRILVVEEQREDSLNGQSEKSP